MQGADKVTVRAHPVINHGEVSPGRSQGRRVSSTGTKTVIMPDGLTGLGAHYMEGNAQQGSLLQSCHSTCKPYGGCHG